MRLLIPVPSWLRSLLERDWDTLRRFYREALIAYLSGAVIGLVAVPLRYRLYTDVEYLFYALRDVNSYPLLQLMGGWDALQRLSFALRTNLIFEPLLLILPGILMLSYPLLILKFLLTGLIATPILLSHPILLIAFTPIIPLEAAGFTIAALAGGHLGRAIFKPRSLYGEARRAAALKKALKELSLYYIPMLLILTLSSLLEVGLSLIFDIF